MYDSERFSTTYYDPHGHGSNRSPGKQLAQFLSKKKLRPGEWWISNSKADKSGGEFIEIVFLKKTGKKRTK